MTKEKKVVQEEPLEKKPWANADKLFKSMNAFDYKHIVFWLAFLKYISDAFEELYQQLKAIVKLLSILDDKIDLLHRQNNAAIGYHVGSSGRQRMDMDNFAGYEMAIPPVEVIE